ncbi:MAG: hypothetical protein V4620_01985 [Bacteroidota bacterium]
MQQEDDKIIASLFQFSEQIRYVAIYRNQHLTAKQKQQHPDSSSGESDKYEELFVNPALLTLARQRGNVDCGGLNFMIIAYGNFFQLIKEIDNGHISICLDKTADLTHLPQRIFNFISTI